MEVQNTGFAGVSHIFSGDFVMISKVEFEGILGEEIIHFWKCPRVPGQACARSGVIEVNER